MCAAEEIEVVAGLVENGFGIAVLPYMDIVRLHNIATIPVETSLWKSKFYIARRSMESVLSRRMPSSSTGEIKVK